ncbi:MAG: septum formation initiator family protein [Oscillospiraceae bacterium]|nr:septum formation initiator family protein [Oscillospiraceae bacterium]
MQGFRLTRLSKYILIALVLFVLAGVTALQTRLYHERQELQALSEELNSLEQENLDLEQRIAALGSDESAEQIARERLNWVYGNEVVYVDSGE